MKFAAKYKDKFNRMVQSAYYFGEKNYYNYGMIARNRIYSCSLTLEMNSCLLVQKFIKKKKLRKKPVLVDSFTIVRCHVFYENEISSIVTENLIEAL